MTTTPNRQTAILITADWVIAYDPATDSHVEIANGAVLVRGERIDRVGRRSDLANVLADKRIDLGAAVLMPGLIDLDALTDIDHLILDSWASGDAAKSLTWSSSYFDSPRAVFTQQQRLQVRHYGLVQLALHGITTYMPIASEVHSDWAETREDMLAMGRASSELGLRGFLGPSFRSGVNVVDASGRRGVRFKDGAGEAGLREALDFVDDLATLGDPLLTGVLLPCRIETLTPMVLREVARAASDRWLLVRLHALQGMAERTIIDRLYDCTPLQLLEWAGLLSDRLIIPHGIVLDVHPDVAGVDRGDLSVLARAGVSIVHCPLTNARYGHQLHTFTSYRRAGINLCLGTDSFPPDLIRGIDAGVSTAKIQSGDLGSHQLAGYIEAATLGGARALHRPDLGRITPGAQADLAAFSLADVRSGPTEDPLRTLVLNGTARDAILTMVAGRVVMRDGLIPGVDLDEVRRTGQRLFELMRAAYPRRDYRHQPVERLFPPVFPRR